MLAGARISFLVGLTVVSFSALIGTMLGAMAAYFGGVVDDLVSRIVDVLLAFPGLLLAIALVAVLGPSLGNVLFALTIIGWVGYARLVRGQVLRAREFDTSRRPARSAPAQPACCGAISFRRRFRLSSCRRRSAWPERSSAKPLLSFLGLGVQPPTPSWGTMLNGGRAHLLDAPHLTLFPGIAIALLVLGFNFVGDGLRDLADPREQR